MPSHLEQTGPRLLGYLASRQFWRYILAGVWNTAFGYSSYALATILIGDSIPHGYAIAYLIASLLNITVAFLGYKWFVFKTSGNYLREWVRCIAVYGGGLSLNLALLPLLVFLISSLGYSTVAPYWAGAILMGVTALLSFFGHKHFSFRSR